MKRAFLLALTVATVFHLRDAGVGAQTPPDTLKFFKNYFVTGDYVAAGVGLRGKGTGGYATDHIEVTGVPAGADIVAAFLYWQVVSKSGADTGSSGVRFNGYSLEADNPATPAVDPEPFGKALEFAGTAPCYNPGGSNGQGSAITWTYRADVLRFFEADFTGAAGSNPNYGKLIVNGPHEVTVPDSGPDGNRSPMALGASLVVIYRVPSMNLSAVVLYDEGVTLANAQRTLVQPMQGFYQASATPNARISYIVGSGQAAKNDYVVVPGAAGAYENVFAATDDDNWDTLTYPAAVAMNASQVQTTISVDVSGGGGGDCLTPAAIVFKADVQDTDGDGLLDVWETAGAPAGGTPQLVDPNGQPLPPLGAMGARPDVRDLFIEIGYMQNGDATYGGVPKPAHSHLPSHAALKKVGDTFSQAPPAGGSPAGIQVHFDVGPDYPAGDPLDEDNNAEVYIIRGRGGEAIDESVTVCDPGEGAPEWACQFAAYPGTVGWKSGFRFLRDQVIAVNGEPAPANFDEEVCGTTVNGTTYACERRFDRSRMNMFHYALFAHAVGLPKSEQACLASDGTPVEADQVTDRCPDGTTPNPEFHTPRTNTGVGDFIGADLMVTLGGFPDVDGLPIGTPFMQASTLLHELGHNFERRHGGGALEPNCKPTYLSVMNYLYQLRGLLSNDGTPNLDFAGAPVGPTVDEMNLIGDVDDARYRLGWYAPLIGSYREGHATAALRHCNGSDLAPGEGPVGGMVRLDASTAGTDIDWDADGNPTTTVTTQDVNFNGAANEILSGSDDWANLRMNQIGSRRNVGGLFIDPVTGAFLVGPLSGDVGKGDLGKGDLGKGDLGKGDLGKGDLGKGDLGKGDLGKGDLGKGDLGKGDLGGGDLFQGDPNNPSGELDAETAGDLARTPPNRFTACVIDGQTCGTSADPLHRVLVTFESSNTGGSPVGYKVVRVEGDTLQNGQPWVDVASVGADDFDSTRVGIRYYSAVDTEELPNDGRYTYFAVAVHGPEDESDPSNAVAIVAVNDPPEANDDAYSMAEDTTLSVSAPGVLDNDVDPDSAGATFTATLKTGPAHALSFNLSANGAFSYTPVTNFNGSDSFEYSIDGDTATVTITVDSVNDPPSGTNRTVTVAEDNAHTFGAADFGFADPDDSPANQFAAVTITTVPAAGMLRFGLSAVTAGQIIPAASLDQLTFAPVANANGAPYASFTFQVQDDGGTSPGIDLDPTPNVVTINVTAVNDAPTIAPVPLINRTIDWNTNTGPIAFTIGDVDGLAGLTVAAVSSDTTLVPTENIAFGGNGAARTVTVTPAADQFGSATITVTVSDGLAPAQTSFLLTVNRVQYTFVAVANLPPSKTKSGSTTSMKWRYQNGTTVLDTSSLTHTVTVCRVVAGGCTPVDSLTNTDSGGSSFRYTNGTWTFNLQTKDRNGTPYPAGDYQVTIVPGSSRYAQGGPYALSISR